MKLYYNLKKKKVDTGELLDKYSGKEINGAALLKEFVSAEVFCSTYSEEYDHDCLLPLFVSKEDARTYYDKAGRKDCLITKKTIFSIIETNVRSGNEKNARVTTGVIIDPEKHHLIIAPDDLEEAWRIILKENDHLLHYKKAYLCAGIIFSILMALMIGLIFVSYKIIDGLNPDCQAANASVTAVDPKKNKVTVSCMGREYKLEGVSDGNIWTFSSDQIHGNAIKVHIAGDKAYADYDSLKYNSTVWGKINEYSYVAVIVFFFLAGMYFGEYIAAGMREKLYKRLNMRYDVITTGDTDEHKNKL